MGSQGRLPHGIPGGVLWDTLALGTHWPLRPVGPWGPLALGAQWPLGPRALGAPPRAPVTIFTPDSRFDQWLRGDESAPTADEKKGYQIFKHSGCVACHIGPAVGEASYQMMGVFEPYQTDNPAEGRAAV